MKGTSNTGLNTTTKKKKRDFTRSFKINDINTDKMLSSKDARTIKTETGAIQPIADEYKDPQNPRFRDDYLPFGKQDMNLRFKCPLAVNPKAISENDKLPMEVQRK